MVPVLPLVGSLAASFLGFGKGVGSMAGGLNLLSSAADSQEEHLNMLAVLDKKRTENIEMNEARTTVTSLGANTDLLVLQQLSTHQKVATAATAILNA